MFILTLHLTWHRNEAESPFHWQQQVCLCGWPTQPRDCNEFTCAVLRSSPRSWCAGPVCKAPQQQPTSSPPPPAACLSGLQEHQESGQEHWGRQNPSRCPSALWLKPRPHHAAHPWCEKMPRAPCRSEVERNCLVSRGARRQSWGAVGGCSSSARAAALNSFGWLSQLCFVLPYPWSSWWAILSYCWIFELRLRTKMIVMP